MFCSTKLTDSFDLEFHCAHSVTVITCFHHYSPPPRIFFERKFRHPDFRGGNRPSWAMHKGCPFEEFSAWIFSKFLAIVDSASQNSPTMVLDISVLRGRVRFTEVTKVPPQN